MQQIFLLLDNDRHGTDKTALIDHTIYLTIIPPPLFILKSMHIVSRTLHLTINNNDKSCQKT